MIVRILGEGQVDVPDEALERLNDARRHGRGSRRGRRRGGLQQPPWTRCSPRCGAEATPHDVDSLDESDLILPPADATMAEVAQMLTGDGLIPG